MRPVADMPPDVAAGITVLLTDIDDTLTTDGRLPSCAYAALEELAVAGIAVVPVTGRPAGWCDLIARMWPVAGVVGENGAFWFAYDGVSKKMRRSFAVPASTRAADRAALDTLAGRILSEVPGCAISADQRYREADLAIDFCEDVPPLPKASVARIVALFEAAGAVAKVSSIHVNGWFGTYDKLTTTRRFAAEVLGMDERALQGRGVFVGDSPNDAPMFGWFPQSCGVANVLNFRGELAAEPTYVTRREGGEGFIEVAHRLLSAREVKRGAA